MAHKFASVIVLCLLGVVGCVDNIQQPPKRITKVTRFYDRYGVDVSILKIDDKEYLVNYHGGIVELKKDN